MSEMVEKVARAILAGHDWTGDSTGEPDEPRGWESLPGDWQDAYRSVARAAIEALREPTDAMQLAGVETYGETEGFGLQQQLGLVFSGMVFAALSTTPRE